MCVCVCECLCGFVVVCFCLCGFARVCVFFVIVCARVCLCVSVAPLKDPEVP